QLVGRQRQPVLETGEVVDRVGAVSAHPGLDQAPGLPQLAEVVLGAGEDATARVGQARRQLVAEPVPGHAQSMAEWTQLLTRSIRRLCQGSGILLLVRYANDTPESGSAQQYDEPTPPWPKVRGEASEPRPRIVSVVPRTCGPSPRCMGMPMF